MALVGVSFALPRNCVRGRSMRFKVTSCGIEIGVPPIREGAGAVDEKHCAREGRENAGTRKAGIEQLRVGSCTSRVKQRLDAGQNIVHI
jgi:hypothetical protein